MVQRPGRNEICISSSATAYLELKAVQDLNADTGLVICARSGQKKIETIHVTQKRRRADVIQNTFKHHSRKALALNDTF